MTRARARCLVIGVGNPDRGDDGAGPAVARLLQGTLPAAVAVVAANGEATALVERLADADRAVLVDAAQSGAPAGTVRRFDAAAAPLPHGSGGVSSHGFGLAAAIELARALGQLPRRCVVYAIEGASFAAGAPLSPAVAAATAEVAGRIRTELADHGW
jgi:hydrogenase maturation protease